MNKKLLFTTFRNTSGAFILFLNKKSSEGIRTAVYSIGWLGIYTLLGFLTLIIIK